jgi:TDG/mug DNA glycosylase family protein
VNEANPAAMSTRIGFYDRIMPLRDLVGPDVRVLFVGINPGMRSDEIGHHFAGYSNRFWKLLHESGIVPEPIGARDDVRLPEWKLGITNLVPRATPGIDTLARAEYVDGLQVLRRKVRRWRPEFVAFVGVSLYRFVFGTKSAVTLGPQQDTFEGAKLVVLPNPSGRNANFSYAEMLDAFTLLAAELRLPITEGHRRIETRRATGRNATPRATGDRKHRGG